MEWQIRELINKKDLQGLRNILSQNPALANEGLPYDASNTAKAHPLHRICDGVFSGKYSDADGVEMAKIFLEYGANINGGEMVVKKDSPLVAAASLHADQLAIFYIDQGADIHHPGCHGGTALHWAAWCGRPKVVKRLLEEQLDINKLCIDFKSTPLFWAVHGLKSTDSKDLSGYLECVRILVAAGSDKSIPNADGNTVFDLIGSRNPELKILLA
ncbi:ankyrin repeat domain-containing protein [Emticicia sp. BO119]|uniref:ankyrin repeat domain-containing protein n=1 Tax=Emticicia sp. BO119 TaxID=2757768 RepID=UPI0015F09215|nr:ankyrin repeat domain-containing protein [Emticicia sp. BO119]MBA4850275.1 ankyrin repeat domain-containing protein [Emticicia sp. BO119]